MSSRSRAPTRPHQGLPEEAATPRRHEDATGGTTPRQTRWDRHRIRATITARARAPSVGSSRISRSEQGRSRLLIARAALSIAPGRSPRARPAPSRASGSLRATSPASTCPGLPRNTSRLRERCVSPTSATTSHHEHLHAARFPTVPASQSLACARAWEDLHRPAREPRRGSRLLDTSPNEPSGRAPLDGGPPASALPQPANGDARTEVPAPPPHRTATLHVDPRSRDPA